MRVGLVVMDENPADALRTVGAADRAGVHSLWTIDYYSRSRLSRAAAFAAVSENSIVGTSVTPLFARSPLPLPRLLPTSGRSPAAALCWVWAAAPAG